MPEGALQIVRTLATIESSCFRTFLRCLSSPESTRFWANVLLLRATISNCQSKSQAPPTRHTYHAMATTATTNAALAQIPEECWNEVFLHLNLSELRAVGSACRYLNSLLFANHVPTHSTGSEMVKHCNNCKNNEFWHRFLYHRTWTVDPTIVLSAVVLDACPQREPWMQHVSTMALAEQDRQRRLDRISTQNVTHPLDCHFLGDKPLMYGWTRIYMRSSKVWESCSFMRRVSESEQVEMTADTNNPVEDPKPYVFIIQNSQLPMLCAAQSAVELELWMDKIEMHIHELKFPGTPYRAPARFKLKRSKKRKLSTST